MIDGIKKSKWMQMFEQAKEYASIYGNLSVPKSYDKKLFNWVKTQRLAYKNRSIPKEERTNNFLPLDDEQVSLLESIGMDFEPSKNSNDVLWMKMYRCAKNHFEKYGTLSEIVDDVNLSRWLSIQILSYKNRSIPESLRKNSYLPLSDEKVDLLEDIGMVWEPFKGGLNRIWLEMYEEAKNYYLTYGNLIVGTNYRTSTGKKLGFWVYHQRQAYKNRGIVKEYRKNGLVPLTDEQVDLLESIGMIWNANNIRCKWNLNYDIAKKFYLENGHLFVPKSIKTIYGKSLSQWIREQQKAVDYDKLSLDQVFLLSEIGIKKRKKFDEYTWNDYYKRACEFFYQNGHLNIPKKFITFDGIKLGLWLDRQIRNYKNDLATGDKILNDEQVKLLENIGVVWKRSKTFEENWNEKYNIALEFYKLNGHLKPSRFSTFNEEVQLYRWLCIQQRAYKNRTVPDELRYFKVRPLTDEQVKLLEDIGMVWDDKEEIIDDWESNFLFAKSIFDEYGSLEDVSSSMTPVGLRLKHWLLDQRMLYKRGTLTKTKIEKLESIGIIWNMKEFYFVTKPLDSDKKVKLEKRFLEYLSSYVKCHKNEICSYDDVLAITNGFIDTLGGSENNYRRK